MRVDGCACVKHFWEKFNQLQTHLGPILVNQFKPKRVTGHSHRSVQHSSQMHLELGGTVLFLKQLLIGVYVIQVILRRDVVVPPQFQLEILARHSDQLVDHDHVSHHIFPLSIRNERTLWLKVKTSQWLSVCVCVCFCLFTFKSFMVTS